MGRETSSRSRRRQQSRCDNTGQSGPRATDTLEFYRKLFSDSPVGMAVCSSSGQCVEANNAIGRIVGATREAVLKQNFHTLESWKKSGLWDAAVEAIRTNAATNLEVTLVSSFERLLTAVIHFLPFSMSGDDYLLCIFEDRTERQKLENELREARDDLEKRVEERTERLRELNAQLVHAEKLSAIGALSASIAHEFRNPLYGIQTVFEGIRKNASLDPEDIGLVELALSECDRLKKLIGNLQDFNRPSSGRRELTDLADLIEGMTALVRKEMKKHDIVIRKEFAPALPPVSVVPDQIKQVILNLFNNAKEAMQEGGGTITITANRDGDKVLLHIDDTGSGMNPEVLDRVFEPFFTTKSAVKGTGLGLSVSYGIMKAHGGELRVESTQGRGSRFTIVFPASPGT